jgi:hypothetical protein
MPSQPPCVRHHVNQDLPSTGHAQPPRSGTSGCHAFTVLPAANGRTSSPKLYADLALTPRALKGVRAPSTLNPRPVGQAAQVAPARHAPHPVDRPPRADQVWEAVPLILPPRLRAACAAPRPPVQAEDRRACPVRGRDDGRACCRAVPDHVRHPVDRSLSLTPWHSQDRLPLDRCDEVRVAVEWSCGRYIHGASQSYPRTSSPPASTWLVILELMGELVCLHR